MQEEPNRLHARTHLGTRKQVQMGSPGAKNRLGCSYGHSTWAKFSWFFPKHFPLAKQCTVMIRHLVTDTDKPLPAKYAKVFCKARVTWVGFAEIKHVFSNQAGIFPGIVHQEELCWVQVWKEARDACACLPLSAGRGWHLLQEHR